MPNMATVIEAPDTEARPVAAASPSDGTTTERAGGIVEDLLRPALVEFVATTLFLFFCVGHVIFNIFKPNADGDFVPTVDGVMISVMSIGFSFGMMIFVLAYSTATLSGGHINPAVTVAMMMTRRISATKGFLYIIAQCLGATVGCGMVAACCPEEWLDDGKLAVGYNSVNTDAGFTAGGAFLAEAIGTSILMFTVMACSDANQQKSDHITAIAPLAIGTSVFLAHLILIPVTGCSINPARTFGASVVTGNFDDHHIFWFGPIFGSVLTAFIYDLLLDQRPDSQNCASYMKGKGGW